MKQADLAKMTADINQERLDLTKKKSGDYADEDALSNFKRMAWLCYILDIDPRLNAANCAKFLMLLKIDRWSNLTRKGTAPNNESIKDTILDLHNYVDLAYACEMK